MPRDVKLFGIARLIFAILLTLFLAGAEKDRFAAGGGLQTTPSDLENYAT